MQQQQVQYIRNHITYEEFQNLDCEQLSQIKLNERFKYELYKCDERIIVEDADNRDFYFLYSPDLPMMTMDEILVGLGFENYMVRVEWTSDGPRSNAILDMPALDAPVSQIRIRSPRVNQD